MPRSRDDIDRNDLYHRTNFVPADEVPGSSWLHNLGKTLLIGGGALLGFKFLSHRPSLYKHIAGATKELKAVPLVNEAKKVLQFRAGVSSVEMPEFVKKTSSIFSSKYANVADDMEMLTIEDLMSASRQTVIDGDKEFVKFTLSGGSSSFRMAREEYNVLEDAVVTGVMKGDTNLGIGIYKEGGNAYDLRAFQVDRWLATNAKRVSKVLRVPVLNFGPLDFTFTDLWADKPFFVGMDLSKRGITTRKPFYIGGELYDITKDGINVVSKNANVIPTAGNMGYAYAQLAGILDEQLYGARALHKHVNYKHIDYDVFEKNIYPDLLKDPQRHLKEASEAWAENKDLPFYLKWMTENNAGFLADFSPMYARQEGWISSGSRVFDRWTNDDLIPVLIDPVQFKEMSKIEQARDSIISILGGETPHIKWLTRQDASDLKAGVLEVGDIYRKANKRVGHSQAMLAGIYKTRLEQDAGQLTGKAYSTTKIRIPKYFVYDEGNISNFDIGAQYTAERIQRLPEAMFGFGIRPSNRWDKQFLRQLTHIAVPAAGIYYGINLASDILGGVTGGYGDPRKALVHGAGAALFAKQAILNATGISVMAHHFEEVMPGSTDSLLAEGGFLLGGAYIGAKVGRKFGNTKAGIIAGMITGAALAIGDPAKKLSTLRDEMTGKKLVAVRKNKGWMLGRQDFKGDEVKYFRQHWYRRAIDQPGMKAKYGNAFNYWAHGSLPGQVLQTALTPLGIGNNYWLEEKGPWAHSYPISNPMLQDVPFIGPLLEWSIGSVLKPYRNYVPEGRGWRPPYKFTESGLTYEEMDAIGASPVTENRSIPQHPFSFLNQIGNFLYNMEQYTGLIGWASGMILGQFNQGEQLESFHRLYGAPYRYYSAEAGGMFGTTEYLRRFIPKGPSKLAYYNTLPYQYPNNYELPGTLSKNLEDRTYPIDLYYGGPTKVPYGEVRLPGPGSEYIYNTGNDTLDDYLMLSYLTPGSKVHKDMRSLVKTWIKSGVIDSDTAKQLGWAQYSVSTKLERMRFKPLQYSTEFTEADKFYMDFADRLFGTNEISPNRLPKDPKAREAVLAYNSSLTGNEYSDFDIPIFDSIAGSTWERLTHIDVPIPMLGTMLTRKLIHNRTALEEYEFSRIYSNSFASWDSWFTSIFTDTLYNLGDMLDLDIKPGRVQKESDIIEYMDSIKYLKYRQLEQQALLYNQPKIASKLSELSKQTIVGLDNTNPFDLMKSAFRAMPGPDKPFLKPFMFSPYSDRERILDSASPHMASLLQKVWKMGNTKDYRDIQRKADLEASIIANKYMRKLGPVNPLVWHPSYDVKRERIRLTRQEALDIHRFGDWEMEEIRYNDGMY